MQTYCRLCEEPTLSDMQLILDKLGEDPEGVTEILLQRAASEGPYLRGLLLEMAAYLETVQSPAA
jgi:hypothetical protein